MDGTLPRVGSVSTRLRPERRSGTSSGRNSHCAWFIDTHTKRCWARRTSTSQRRAAAASNYGSGGGFFREVDPSVFTSDIRILLGLDAVFDARWMPFADGSVDVIFAMHVVHHIAQPRLFLAELQRVLKPGGALVAVEPFWSPMARLLYTYAHPEVFDRSAETWEFESSGAMSSNQAMTYLFLEATSPSSQASSQTSK